jgi:hypothetical protein
VRAVEFLAVESETLEAIASTLAKQTAEGIVVVHLQGRT